MKNLRLLLLMHRKKRGWDKSPSLSIVFGLSSKTQWLSGLYYADFISFYSPTKLCGGGATKSNSNELPISVPLSFLIKFIFLENRCEDKDSCKDGHQCQINWESSGCKEGNLDQVFQHDRRCVESYYREENEEGPPDI